MCVADGACKDGRSAGAGAPGRLRGPVHAQSTARDIKKRVLHKVFERPFRYRYRSHASQPKDRFGKHCFGYAALLANEFYFAEPMDYLCLAEEPKSPDNLVAVRTDLNADWAQVTKDAE